MKSLQASQAPQEKKSFEELQLKNDRIELTILPGFGCHWTRLRFSVKGNWLDFLVSVPDHEVLLRRPAGYGSYIMAPWSNRIAGAAFTFDGEKHQLRENFPDRTAIHGDVRTRPWRVVNCASERFEASLDSRELGDFNFPFAFFFRHSIELSAERLRVELSIENVDQRRAPAGMGFHPFLRRRLTRLDRDVILVVPAEKVYPAEGCIPTGVPVSVAGRTDLRHLKLLGRPALDHCFTSLRNPEFRVIYPGTRVEARLTMDPVFSHAVIYAPNDPTGKPREFVAVEPVTQANDGFNLLARGMEGTGVKILEPGERWGGIWEMSVGDI